MTLGELHDLYLRHRVPALKSPAPTLSKLRCYIPKIEALPTDQVTQSIARAAEPKHVKQTTRDSAREALRAMLYWGYEEGLIDHLPLVTAPRQRPLKAQILTADQLNRIESAAHTTVSEEFYLYLRVLRLSAMKPAIVKRVLRNHFNARAEKWDVPTALTGRAFRHVGPMTPDCARAMNRARRISEHPLRVFPSLYEIDPNIIFKDILKRLGAPSYINLRCYWDTLTYHLFKQGGRPLTLSYLSGCGMYRARYARGALVAAGHVTKVEAFLRCWRAMRRQRKWMNYHKRKGTYKWPWHPRNHAAQRRRSKHYS